MSNVSDEGLTRRLADTPIAVVGLGALFPKSRNVHEFWRNVLSAADCTEDVPDRFWSKQDYFDPDPAAADKTYCHRGGVLPTVPFHPMDFGIPPATLQATDIVQLLSLVVARDTLRDAGIGTGDWYRAARTGVVLGISGPLPITMPLGSRLQTPVLREVALSMGLSERDAQELASRFSKAFVGWQENSFPGLLGNVVAGRVANRLNLGGLNCTVDAACASSLAAIRTSVSELVEGRSDMMLTGGCAVDNTILAYISFSKTPALSPSGKVRPFDQAADGTVIGDGVGMLALRRLEDAERDGNRIYALLRGIGASSDGRFTSIYAPRKEGQVLALRRAYADAGISPASCELFEAHGTGTTAGDQVELSALSQVLGECTDERQFAAIGSVKSQIGHTKAAAGAAGVIKTVLSLHQKTLPPTINVDRPSLSGEVDDSVLYVNTKARPWIRSTQRTHRRGAVSSFGFGGTNFHCVFEEYDPSRPDAPLLSPNVQVALWSAADPAALASALEAQEKPHSGPVAASAARIGFTYHTEEEFRSLRALAVERLRSDPEATAWNLPSGIVYRRTALATTTKVAALFAGQGSQYVDMGRTAALAGPPVRAAFDAANSCSTDPAHTLSRTVFPPPAFDENGRRRQEELLRRPEHAQPAVGALSAGQYRWLTQLGFRADAYAGHSFGELTALWAAGAFDDATFFELAQSRGAAMAPPAVDGYDPGAMVALTAPENVAGELVAEHRGLSVCNVNAPDQVVVGGPTDQCTQLISEAARRGIEAVRLPVAAAFHTRHVDHATVPFRAAVAKAAIRAPKLPVSSNRSGRSYGADVAANAALLVEQLRHPVMFAEQLTAMYAAGCRVFVEFGPRSVLTGLARRTLPADAICIATDAGPNRSSELALKKAALQLAVLGLPITDIGRYDAEPPVEPVGKGPAVELRGVNVIPDEVRAEYARALASPYRIEASMNSDQGQDHADLAAPDMTTVTAPPEPAGPAALNGTSTSLPQLPDIPPAVATGDLTEFLGRQLDLHQKHMTEQLELIREWITSGVAVSPPLKTVEDRVAVPAEADREVPQVSPTHLNGNAAPAPAPAPATAPAPASAAVVAAREVLLEVVAQKTGYPAEMLDESMDIEADLGIDSIKRVEIVSALRDEFPVVRNIGPERLAELRTLEDVVRLLISDDEPTTSGEPVPAPATTPAPAPAPASAAVVAAREVLLEVVAQKTGYPAEMLDESMDIEADLGIDSIKRVEIVSALRDQFPVVRNIGPERLAELRTLEDVVRLLISDDEPPTNDEPAPAPATTPAPAPAPASAAVVAAREVLLEVVAQKTGYPAEMLDESMDIEADLGIDSIKRVEIVSALRDQFPVVRNIGPERLAELRTLEDVVRLLISDDEPPTAVTPVAPGVDRLHLGRGLLGSTEVVPDTYASGAVALIVDDGATFTGEIVRQLAAAGVRPRVLVLPGVVTTAPGSVAIHRLRSWDSAELVAVLQDLLTDAGRLDMCLQLAHAPAHEMTDAVRRLTHAILVVRGVQRHLEASAADGRSSYLVLGRHDAGAGTSLPDTVLGGLSGLVKTLQIEAPTLFCRAVEIGSGVASTAVPAIVVAEAFDADITVGDVRHDSGRRSRTVFTDTRGDTNSEAGGAAGGSVAVDDGRELIVVTGGARGITAECLQALVRRHPVRLLILGRTELAEEPAWASGRDGNFLKAAIIDELSARGTRPVPREVERQFRGILAQREVRTTLGQLTASGAQVEYRTVDLTDRAAVSTVLAGYADKVTGLVHGAGALADRLLVDKNAEEVERVLAVKLTALDNVLNVLDVGKLRHVVLFSSVAGVFGNRGQADYATANAALNRIAETLKGRLPESRVTSINWGAWDGGMVTPALREMFLSRGVALLEPSSGAAMFVDQFARGRAGDTVVLIGPAASSAPGATAEPTQVWSRQPDLVPGGLTR